MDADAGGSATALPGLRPGKLNISQNILKSFSLIIYHFKSTCQDFCSYFKVRKFNRPVFTSICTVRVFSDR